MSTTATPIKAFTPRKRIESDRLETLRAKIIKESSNLYKLPSDSSSASTPTSPTKAFEQSRILHNNVPTSAPSLKQEELNRQHDRSTNQIGSIAKKFGSDSLPSIEWEHPELNKIEKRIVNKELETKKVMINLILLLSSNLIYNFLDLIYKKIINMELFELNNPINFNFKNLLIFFQLLFLWNIINGLYKVLKPQDQFTDLNLTPHQRELLGLPQVPTMNTSFEIIKPTTTNTSRTISSEKPEKESFKLSPKKTSHTPIASPMASPSKSFSPKKISNQGQQQQSRVLQLKNQELPKTPNQSTPTYIPSPKYYYRMDSPSRTRRRPL